MILADQQLLDLKSAREYRRTMRLGLKGLASSLAGRDKSDPSDLPVNRLGAMVWSCRLYRRRIIAKEIFDASAHLFERAINIGQCFPTPKTVRDVCKRRDLYIWMRFEEDRVDALFTRVSSIVAEARVRLLIKRFAHDPEHEVDGQLKELEVRFHDLRNQTMTAIRAEMTLAIVGRQAWDQDQAEIVSTFEAIRRSATSLKSVRGVEDKARNPPPREAAIEGHSREVSDDRR